MVYAPLKRRKIIYTSPTEHQFKSSYKASKTQGGKPTLCHPTIASLLSITIGHTLSLSLNLYELFLFIFLGFHNFFFGKFWFLNFLYCSNIYYKLLRLLVVACEFLFIYFMYEQNIVKCLPKYFPKCNQTLKNIVKCWWTLGEVVNSKYFVPNFCFIIFPFHRIYIEFV